MREQVDEQSLIVFEDEARLAIAGNRASLERLVRALQGNTYGLALRMFLQTGTRCRRVPVHAANSGLTGCYDVLPCPLLQRNSHPLPRQHLPGQPPGEQAQFPNDPANASSELVNWFIS